MRTYDVAVTLGLISLALGLSPASSFDGTRTPENVPLTIPQARSTPLGAAAPLGAVPVVPPPAMVGRPLTPGAAAGRIAPTPSEALRSGTQALRDGRPEQAVTALEYAAEQGMPGAIWKLGRMYADGEGVDQNKLRAFEYFRNLTRAHAYDPPGTPQARFVANAFVALGTFYLEGIPNSAVKADPVIAQEMFRYAATYFGDPDAQFYLGRLYLAGQGTQKDAILAARWFKAAAEKGQRSAQATLGALLFKGEELSRQAGLGLAWLTVAKDGAAKGVAGPDDAWIAESYQSAFAQATDNERAQAYRYLEDLVQGRRR